MDCYVQLKKLEDEEIALLCRPKPQQSTVPTNPEMKPALSTTILQVIAENVPEPAAFEEVIDTETGELLFIFMN